MVPSISLERTTAGSGTLMQAMEERALFLLLLLRQPMLTLVYVTSSPIAEEIVEYYLGAAARGSSRATRAATPPRVGRRRVAPVPSAPSCWPGPGCCARSAS